MKYPFPNCAVDDYHSDHLLLSTSTGKVSQAALSLLVFKRIFHVASTGIRAALNPPEAYWNRRLLLNLLLANMGLYFTALFTGIGAFLAGPTPNAARLVLGLGMVVCLYSAVRVPLLTPKDWPHTLPRVMAGVLILVGLLLG